MQHALKPLAVAARLDADEHFTGELRVEVAHRVERVVKKALFFNLAILGVAPLDELLSGMEIYSTIDGHGDSPFLHSSLSASLCRTTRESHLFYHIRFRRLGGSRRTTDSLNVSRAIARALALDSTRQRLPFSPLSTDLLLSS